MEKIQSNRLKCRNLPADYEVLDKTTSKPLGSLATVALCGLVLMITPDYMFLGSLIAFVSFYSLFFSPTVVLVEFCDEFVIFYLDDKRENCYVIYWNEIAGYEYKAQWINPDYVKITLMDGSVHSFKCLSRQQLMRNFQKHVHLISEEYE